MPAFVVSIAGSCCRVSFFVPDFSTLPSASVALLYFRSMKMHIAAIGFNERDLELYVSQLKTQGFESLSEVKKADDGSFYRVMAKASKFELAVTAKAPAPNAEPVSA